ncbi:3565_t:CDS:1, partial [Funneliformis geosporum]
MIQYTIDQIINQLANALNLNILWIHSFEPGLAQWPINPMDVSLLKKSNRSMEDIGSIEIINLI